MTNRRREEDRKPHQILWFQRRREQWHYVGRELVHAVAAPRTCTHEHQSAYELGTVERDLLGDESSHREAEEINLLEVESVDERGGVASPPSHGPGCFAGAESDAGVVGEDYLPAHGEGVGYHWVVVVEVSHEVLEQHDRRADRVAEASVGEAGPVGFDEFGRDCVVGVSGHVSLSHGELFGLVAASIGVDKATRQAGTGGKPSNGRRFSEWSVRRRC